MRSTDLLHVFHSDVCGPMEVPSSGGNLHFVTFVDEFCRRMWLYLIKQKSEVFATLEKFQAMAKRHSGKQIKILRTDGGKEYTSREFEAHCTRLDIQHEVTTSYTPQHNGLVERRNRIVLNMCRSILKQKGLPKSFWGEVVATTTF